jgi:hypothetical protein
MGEAMNEQDKADLTFLQQKDKAFEESVEISQLRALNQNVKNLITQKTPTEQQIAEWCEANLFGEREVQGVKLTLTPTQLAVKGIAVEIITKWEARDK